ncbi:sulfotransferase [Nocardioides zeicaulis]|uniref:Sulfotransferase n=1 Tax=Nocardioides zeicaulis TaxID=1776857 RepID=A0ABV6DZH2_9ACTN
MKVLYIVGVGRSGSTLLERVLGAQPGWVNAGELNALFSRVARQDQRCGCGTPFSECPFWVGVGARAFGGWDEVTEQVSRLQPRVVRQRYVPRLLSGAMAPAARRELDAYLDVHARLYRALAEVAGAEVVVDASKSTAQLFALRRIEGLDLRVLNLVRDPRGVASSWSKSGIRKPQSRDGESMGTYSPHRLAVLWAALQAESSVLGSAAAHATRVRYEDLVAAPRTTVERALREVGLPAGPGALDHVGDTSVDLGPSHGVAGSRTRFLHGRIELHLDDAWHTALPPVSRRVVTAITLPQLLAHGYVGSAAARAGSGSGSGTAR